MLGSEWWWLFLVVSLDGCPHLISHLLQIGYILRTCWLVGMGLDVLVVGLDGRFGNWWWGGAGGTGGA